MLGSCSQPQRQHLRLLIPQGHSSISSPISDSGLTTSGATPSTGDPDWFICNVICLFDFESDDPHHLPFTRNEILTIVKMEESGWWAAMRPEGDRLGWIPSSFVERLAESATELVDKQDDDTRIHHHEGGNTSISEAETNLDCMQLGGLLSSDLDVAKSPLLSSCLLACGGFQSSGRSCGPYYYNSFFSLSDNEPSPHSFTDPFPSPLSAVSQSPITPSNPGPYAQAKALHTLDSSISHNFSIDPERSLPSSPYYPHRPRRLAVLVKDSDSLSRLSAFIDQDPSSAFHVLDNQHVKETFNAFSRSSYAEEESLFLSRYRS